MQYAINIGTFIEETDSGFTLVTHPLGNEPHDPTFVGSFVEIPVGFHPKEKGKFGMSPRDQGIGCHG